ncbi:SOS response-associated peptidase [Halostella sp. JP-L12]|uniref:SOS response-associated peptidase n=1 Tax=Halostella TaxID=1843185 RepID=UPI000EF78041|nr:MULTISPECIES: SOS response-associated peptidase [Halostella]NHN46766.1 SOS response-associated peptidase [Halostella sp. JP-L12]
MCGRYSLFAPREDVVDLLDAAPEREFGPRYNMAPGEELPVVRDAASDRIEFLRWGLVPHWADDDGIGNDLINARAETVAEKPSFRDAFRQSYADADGPRAGRCLVPADGFYEWVDEGDGKQPYRVAFEDDRPFAMAGLWATWEAEVEQVGLDAFGDGGDATPETRRLETFAVVTTEPNDLVADLHHRMAVILDEDDRGAWLDADPDAAADLLDPFPADEMRAYPVSTAVNDPSNDAPAVAEPLD